MNGNRRQMECGPPWCKGNMADCLSAAPGSIPGGGVHDKMNGKTTIWAAGVTVASGIVPPKDAVRFRGCPFTTTR